MNEKINKVYVLIYCWWDSWSIVTIYSNLEAMEAHITDPNYIKTNDYGCHSVYEYGLRHTKNLSEPYEKELYQVKDYLKEKGFIK